MASWKDFLLNNKEYEEERQALNPADEAVATGQLGAEGLSSLVPESPSFLSNLFSMGKASADVPPPASTSEYTPEELDMGGDMVRRILAKQQEATQQQEPIQPVIPPPSFGSAGNFTSPSFKFKSSVSGGKEITPVDNTLDEAAKQPEMVEKEPTELEKAQARARDLKSKLLMMQGLTEIGTSLASRGSVKADTKAFEAASKQADSLVTDLQEQQKAKVDEIKQNLVKMQAGEEAAKADYKSPISTAYRNTLLQLAGEAGIKVPIPENASANDLEKLYPTIMNIVTAKQARDDRRANLQIAMADKEAKRLVGRSDDKFRMETKVRNELNDLDTKWGFTQGRNVIKTLDAMLENKKAMGLTDVYAMFKHIKGLDQTSVVRESETKLLEQAQSALQTAMNSPNKILKGEIFAPEFRKELTKTMKLIQQRNEDSFKKASKPLLNTAKNYDLNVENILMEQFGEQTAPQGGTVKIRNKQTGAMYSVPSENLQKALASGKYEEAN